MNKLACPTESQPMRFLVEQKSKTIHIFIVPDAFQQPKNDFKTFTLHIDPRWLPVSYSYLWLFHISQLKSNRIIDTDVFAMYALRQTVRAHIIHNVGWLIAL